MGTLGRCGDLVYSINQANVKNGTLDSEAAKAEFANLVGKQYDEALYYLRSSIEPPEFNTITDARILNPQIGYPGNYSATLSLLIDDHDHDSLTLTAESADTSIATVAVTDTHVVMTCVGNGDTVVTLTAENIKGKATMTFNLKCIKLPGA